MPVVSSKARVPSAPKTPPSGAGVASPTNASPAAKSVALFSQLADREKADHERPRRFRKSLGHSSNLARETITS